MIWYSDSFYFFLHFIDNNGHVFCYRQKKLLKLLQARTAKQLEFLAQTQQTLRGKNLTLSSVPRLLGGTPNYGIDVMVDLSERLAKAHVDSLVVHLKQLTVPSMTGGNKAKVITNSI